MSVSQALTNIRLSYRFHAGLKGARPARLGYVSLYYLFYLTLRWGERHLRALELLRKLGLPSKVVRVRTPDGHWMTMDLHTAYDPLFFIHADRSYDSEPDFAPRAGWRVLDVGANVGVYALFAAARVGDGGAVAAVEPHPANFQRLSDNVKANAVANVALVEAAAGDANGRGELFVHDREINHSMVRAAGRSVPVRVTTLDSLVEELGWPRVDLLKIDTEGTLPAVIRGAAGLIKRWRPFIAYEKDTPEESAGLAELLDALGYDVVETGPMAFARPRGGHAS